MPSILQSPKTVKATIERQLIAAQRAADAYVGRDPGAYFPEADFDFDFLDVKSGELQLLHNDPDCPFCRLRRIKRAYDRITSEGSPHGKAPH